MINGLTTIINQIFPTDLEDESIILNRYPKREIPETAMVTRIAPSPTGFVHLGSLYAALISERFAHQTNGIFILRIEDTDKKREVIGTANLFASTLEQYRLKIDEGLLANGQEKGNYGPYRQSERAEIYQSLAKKLLLKDQAYLCFASPEELETIRTKQEALGERSGYYNQFALWRNRSLDDINEALNKGLKPVIRLKSTGNFNNRIKINDLILGNRELPCNDQDIILIKADGLPTYHFAHAVDDHLMGTTHVIRGNEWFPSLPLHLELFQALGFKAPQYAHLAPIQKLADGKKRKLSKRHDPESNLEYFNVIGYPKEALIEYLLNLANSNFEDWRRTETNLDYQEFKLSWKKLAKSNGPLFDIKKLDNISKEIISRLDAQAIYQEVLSWAKSYKQDTLIKILESDPDYVLSILNIERAGAIKPRKDLSKWSELEHEINYFYAPVIAINQELLSNTLKQLNGVKPKDIIQDFLATYSLEDNQEIWFEKLKKVGLKYGFAPSLKEYKQAESKYKGQIGTIAQLLRLLLTGRQQSPNLAEIMRVLGEKRIKERLKVHF